MPVDIKFEPDGPSGRVAEGTYLWNAARRLGFAIPADCDGRGECDTCAVVVTSGAALLSPLTEAERKQLSAERLAGSERLACQCKVEHGGELSVRLVPRAGRRPTADETVRDLRQRFSELPFTRKMAMLMELETITMSQVLSRMTSAPFEYGEKLRDRVVRQRRKLDRRRAKGSPKQAQKD